MPDFTQVSGPPAHRVHDYLKMDNEMVTHANDCDYSRLGERGAAFQLVAP